MKPEHEILLPLNERNFAHVLAALALAGIAAETPGNSESDCWWDGSGFRLRLRIEKHKLLELADKMLRNLRWIDGLGVDEKSKVGSKAHHGVLTCDQRLGSNPFLSFATQGVESSPLKTFSGQLDPQTILTSQLFRLQSSSSASDWLFQRALGVASWGFDSSVGSHAYDLGFSSNDEGSGNSDPIYSAIELLSLAGAAIYSTPHAWQIDPESFRYSVWRDALPIALVPLAAAGCIDGLKSVTFSLATRGAAYGKGAAYRYFPEASIVTS